MSRVDGSDERSGAHTVATGDDATLHDEVSARLGIEEHRYTDGRRRLVEVLASAGRPVTLPEILAADPELPQSSAYRNLDVLERSGVIRRITVGGEHTHFELAEPLLEHHHHLICVTCGTITDVHLDPEVERLVDRALADAAAQVGFTPLDHSLDLHGHCAECRRSD